MLNVFSRRIESKRPPRSRTPSPVRRSAALALLAVLAASCSSAPASVTQTIGPEGGTIALGGATLTLPPGALAAPTAITIAKGGQAPPPFLTPSGDVFHLTPANLGLRLAAEATLPSSGAPHTGVFLATPQGHGYARQPGRSAGSTVSGRIRYLGDVFAGTPGAVQPAWRTAGAKVATAGRIDAHASGDFNGDHVPDLAVLHAASATVELLLNAGDGSYHSSTVAVSPGMTPALAAGDADGDGIEDVVVASVGAAGALRVQIVAGGAGAPTAGMPSEMPVAIPLVAVDNVIFFGSGDPVPLADGQLHRGYLVAGRTASQATPGEVVLVTDAGMAAVKSSSLAPADDPAAVPMTVASQGVSTPDPMVTSMYDKPVFDPDTFGDEDPYAVIYSPWYADKYHATSTVQVVTKLQPMPSMQTIGELLAATMPVQMTEPVQEIAGDLTSGKPGFTALLDDGTLSSVHVDAGGNLAKAGDTPSLGMVDASSHIATTDFNLDGVDDILAAIDKQLDAIPGDDTGDDDLGDAAPQGIDLPGVDQFLGMFVGDSDGDGIPDVTMFLHDGDHDAVQTVRGDLGAGSGGGMDGGSMGGGMDGGTVTPTGMPFNVTSWSPASGQKGTVITLKGTGITGVTAVSGQVEYDMNAPLVPLPYKIVDDQTLEVTADLDRNFEIVAAASWGGHQVTEPVTSVFMEPPTITGVTVTNCKPTTDCSILVMGTNFYTYDPTTSMAQTTLLLNGQPPDLTDEAGADDSMAFGMWKKGAWQAGANEIIIGTPAGSATSMQ